MLSSVSLSRVSVFGSLLVLGFFSSVSAAREAEDKWEVPQPSLPLQDFRFPTESELISELGLSDRSVYRDSALLVENWVRGRMKKRNKASLTALCASTLDTHETHFPMSAFNLRCVPWWLEQRSFAPKDDGAKRSLRRKRWNRKPVRNLSDWQNLEGVTYRQFVNRFRPRSEKTLLRHARFALNESVGCDSHIGLAGFMNRAEEFLPATRVWSEIQKVYQKYYQCTVNTQLGQEHTHLRMGLTAIFFSELDLAEKALAAAESAPGQNERQRSLFWLGLLRRKETREREIVSHFRNPHWEELRQKFPLSIHTVLASHVQGVDPYNILVGDVEQLVRRRDGLQWNDYNLVALMFDLFVAREAAGALKVWSERIDRNWKETNNDRQLFLALAHAKATNYLGSIKTLTTYLRSSESRVFHVKFLKMLFPTPFQEKILKHSAGLDPLVVYGLIRQESAFNPRARSVANARGLMQLMPATARGLARVRTRDLYDPSKNVRLGSKYLRKLLTRNDHQLERVLAAYNAGQRNLSRWLKRFPGANDLLFADLIPFKETRSYVSLIQRNTYWYGRLWADQKGHYGPELASKMEQSNSRSRTVDSLLKLSWSGGTSQESPLSLLPPVHDLRHFSRKNVSQ